MDPMTLQHIALESHWQAAQATGSYPVSTIGRTIAQEGFMHCSGSPEQLDGVLARFYADVAEPLLALTIDERALDEYGLDVRYEPAVAGGDELFPHVYGGDLPVGCVSQVGALRL